jgi:hypothetical protein
MKSQDHQERIKLFFDNRTKERNLMAGDLVLKWVTRREAKEKHGNLNNLWIGPFQVVEAQENNTYELDQLDGELIGDFYKWAVP